MVTKSPNKKKQRLKILFVSILFCLFYIVIIFRSYQLQIHGNAKLSHLANNQYKTNLLISPQRGTIYDRNGDILAIDVLVASIGIHPQLIQDKDALIKIITEQTDVSKQTLETKLKSKRKFEWVKRRFPVEKGNIIEKAKLKGVQVVHEYRRFYPNKELAGQLLGAVGYDAKALGGLELTYDDYLRSATLKKRVERDARGKFFSTLDEGLDIHDLHLTIDKNIQNFTEIALKTTAQKHKAQSAFAIVMDVDTGELLAMANYPSFNPNAYWKYKQFYWKNHAIIDVFEPGSTFKSILMAAALQNKVVKPNEKIFCENGRYKVGVNYVNDHDPYGWLTAKEVIKVSSNIGVTKIVQKLGRKKFYSFIKDLGFGKKVDIGIGGQSPGLVRHHKYWQDIDLSNISFGQGLSVNGLQMASAYSAIANGGNLPRPYLIKEIKDSTGHAIIKGETNLENNVIDEDVTNDLRKMLHMVTQKGGTAVQAYVPGYLSGGKTGTAQKFDNAQKAYKKHSYVSSFIGFAPLDNPRLVIYAVFDNPQKNGYYGGVVAGPVFKNIAEKSLKYLNVVPQSSQKITIAKNQTKEQKELTKNTDNNKLTLAQKDIKENKVPDLVGLSFRDVLEITQNQNLQLIVTGNGFVKTQSPKKGQMLSKKLTLNLGEKM